MLVLAPERGFTWIAPGADCRRNPQAVQALRPPPWPQEIPPGEFTFIQGVNARLTADAAVARRLDCRPAAKAQPTSLLLGSAEGGSSFPTLAQAPGLPTLAQLVAAKPR